MSITVISPEYDILMLRESEPSGGFDVARGKAAFWPEVPAPG